MKLGLTTSCLALVAGTQSALAAGHVDVSMIPRTTTILGIGETVTIDIMADWSGVPGGLMLAGFKFDIVGTHTFGSAPLGALLGDPNALLPNGRNAGTQIGDLTLGAYAAGQLPPGLGGTYSGDYLGSFSYTYLGPAAGDSNYDEITFSLANYNSFDGGALNVYIGSTGAQSRSGVGIGGSGHEVNINPATITVGLFPTPGTLAVGLAGLIGVGRRRRETR